MGYLRPELRFRHPITVANDGTATVDVEIDIPEHWDHFWDNVRSDGFDAILTAADGVTVLDFLRVSFDVPTRDATMQIGALDVAADADTDSLVWLYYGDAAAADEAGAPVIGSTVPGVPYLGLPTEPAVNVTRRPRQRLSDVVDKASSEVVYVWFHLDSLLEKRLHTDGGALRWEEIKDAKVTVLEDGEARSTMTGLTHKYAIDARGRLFVGAGIQAGIDSHDFTISLEVGTTIPPAANHRILNPRALLRVRDLTES